MEIIWKGYDFMRIYNKNQPPKKNPYEGGDFSPALRRKYHDIHKGGSPLSCKEALDELPKEHDEKPEEDHNELPEFIGDLHLRTSR